MELYPILLEAQTMDLTDLIEMTTAKAASIDELSHDRDAVYSDGTALELESSLTTSITENNLSDFKKYLDDENSEIHNYIGENGIVYSYNPSFTAFTYDPDGVLVNTDGSTLASTKTSQMLDMEMEMYSMYGFSSDNSMLSMYNTQNFDELLPGQDGKVISDIVTDNYEIVHGNWPNEYNEVLLVLNERNEIPVNVLYELGFLPGEEYKELVDKMDAGEVLTVDTKKLSYSDICNQEFKLVASCDMYEKTDDGLFSYIGDDTDKIEKLLEDAPDLRVTGVIRPKEGAENQTITGYVAYTRELTTYLIDYTDNSDVVTAQRDSKDVNILNGLKFSPENDAEKIEDAKVYLNNLGVTEKAKICRDMLLVSYSQNPAAAAQMQAMNESQLAAMMDNYLKNPEDDVLLAIYEAYISTGDYDDNMSDFGYVSLDAPSSIAIYTDSFENKEFITDCIEEYNSTASEENQITYTDYIGILLSSVTTIINVISYVLIAFVSVSLVVSSIMIGIITYISVLERTKEIGILRAMGASKKNISQVFIAETFIEGLCAGLIGIGMTLILLIPANAIIHYFAGSAVVNAALPVAGAVILIVLSVVLTVIAGLFPAKKAARKDPVTALRTE